MLKQYEHLYREARNIEHRYQSIVDQPQHPRAQAMRRQMLELIEDFEKDKTPRSLEDRVKQVVREVEEARAEGEEVMNFGDLDYLRRAYEELQMQLRKLPNY